MNTQKTQLATVSINGISYAVQRLNDNDESLYADRIRTGILNPATEGPTAFARKCYLSLSSEDAEAFCRPHRLAWAAYRQLIGNKPSQKATGGQK